MFQNKKRRYANCGCNISENYLRNFETNVVIQKHNLGIMYFILSRSICFKDISMCLTLITSFGLEKWTRFVPQNVFCCISPDITSIVF